VTTIRRRLHAFLSVAAGDGGVVPAAPPVPVREIIRRFWPYARPYRRWLWLTALFIVVLPAIDTATIWLFKVVVDEVLVPRDFGPFVWIALAYIGLTVLAGVVSFADDYVSTWVGERFLLELRTDFFRHVQSLSLDFFERSRLGDVLSRLTTDIAAIENFVLSGVADALSYVMRITFFLAALFYLQWQLALVSLFVAPLFWLSTRHFSRLIKHASREKRRRSGSIGAVAEESLSNAALVQAYNRQETEVERFHEQNVGSYRATMASTRIRALFTPIIDLIEISGAIVVIGLGTWELSQGRLTLGGLLVFLTYLTQLYSPIRGLSRLSNTIYSASAGAERVIELMDAKPAVVDRRDARPLGPTSGAVMFDHVTFRYPGQAHDALRDITFSAAPGETVALVGASGAGKSTIAKLLLRFYDPSAGDVRLDGRDLRDIRLDELRENVTLLLQETLVFHGTVRENIAYGKPGATDAEIEGAARAADAHDFVTALPNGYDTVVGQKGRRLSGGQRQRIAIARAMIRDAPVLLLDEPTTGLDAETSARIMQPLRRLIHGRATIVISHNLMTARDATRIVVLDSGQVVESGTHAELLARGGAYTRLHELHAGAAAAG
jgi:ABC-type multidrug transport system fused ATPase/permease subunit